MSGNKLAITLEMACDACGGEIAMVEKTWMGPVYRHVGEPCMRFYGQGDKRVGFPVEKPYPTRRCESCWTPGTDTGRIRTHQMPYGDDTRCEGTGGGDGCGRSSYCSIGD